MGKNTGKDYEMLCQSIYKQILNTNGYTNIDVKHNVIIQGKDTQHQIDVYWEFELADFKAKWIIEVKDHNTPISKGRMLEFISIIKDIPNSHGIYVSKSGFQKGAKELAEKNGIMIYELRDPNNDDFEGKMMNLQLNIYKLSPYYENLSLQLNKQKSPNASLRKYSHIWEYHNLQSGNYFKPNHSRIMCS